MADNIVSPMPPSILNLVQQGLLQRAYHEGLMPNLFFRNEALKEEWPANSGSEMFMTREGLITPITKVTPVGTDPTPTITPYEQWSATLGQYSNTKDVHVPTSVVSNANIFLATIKQLGQNAAMSINRIARNKLFQCYSSGQTVILAAVVTSGTQLRVAALNGFTDVVTSVTTRPVPVSAATPLTATLGVGGAAISVSIIAAVPDSAADPFGPGTLTLSAGLAAGFAQRSPLVSSVAPRIVRSSGGSSVDSIGASDTITLQQIINAVGWLRDANVPPHDDGMYHAHISGSSNAQFFQDPVFQRLNQSLPEHSIYKAGFIGSISGVNFYLNTESPRYGNVGDLTPTALLGVYASDINAEVVNGTGVRVGRVILTGKGSLYEKFLDESQYLTDAGLNGKVGEFDVTNNGMQIITENIRLILRAPMDRLQQMIAASWSISTSFACPSDITAPSGPERYKRAIVLEHALST